MADEKKADFEQVHSDALTMLASKLRNSPSVAALVPEQVFGPDAESLARAGEWARAVLVSAGKNYGSQPRRPDQPPLLCQRDAKVELRAESPEVLSLLAVAVVRTLGGSTGGVAYQHCVHTHTSPAADGPGGEYVARTDVFALHCVQPDLPARAVAPPPKVGKAPHAAPPRAKHKKEE